jgi:hypothetical protein
MKRTVAGLISGVDRLGRRWKIIHSGGKIFICGGAGVKSFNAPYEAAAFDLVVYPVCSPAQTRLLLADLAAEVDVIADDLRRWYVYADDLMPKRRN